MPGPGIPIDADRLRALREEKIGRREALAIQAQLSASAITLIENGYRNPSAAALERIAAALRVEPEELVR